MAVLHYSGQGEHFRRPAGFANTKMSTAALLFGAGEATAGNRVTNAAADKNFMEFRFESTHTSGDGRGIYMRYYSKGAAGLSDCARFYNSTEVDGVGGAAGLHASMAIGADKKGVTGLGVGVRGTVDTAAGAAAACTGTYAGIIAETVTAANKGVGVTSLVPLLVRCLGTGVKPTEAIAFGDAEGPLAEAPNTTTAFASTFSIGNLNEFTKGLQISVNGTRYSIPLKAA